jgi:hypothetical protein
MTAAMNPESFQRVTTETHHDGIHRCGPRDALAVAAIAIRCAWRRRRDIPLYDLPARLVAWPLGLMLLAVEGRSAWTNSERSAVVSAYPLRGRGRLRVMLFLSAGVLVPLLLISAGGAVILGQDVLLVVCSLTMALLLPTLWRVRGIHDLLAARRRFAAVGGNALEGVNLIAGTPFAGLALACGLCRYADTTGTTIVAEARGKGRQRLYWRLGFQTVAEARDAAFIVRSPNPPRPEPAKHC